MTQLLNTARIMVATVSLVAILGAPFVIMNTKPAASTAGYGIIESQMDRAEVADTQTKA